MAGPHDSDAGRQTQSFERKRIEAARRQLSRVLDEVIRQALDVCRDELRDFDDDLIPVDETFVARREAFIESLRHGIRDKFDGLLSVAPASEEQVFWAEQTGQEVLDEKLRNWLADEDIRNVVALLLGVPVNEAFVSLRKRLGDFLQELYDAEIVKRPAETVPGSAEKKRFPKRAEWLKQRLKERGWNIHDVQRQRGPNHETVERILGGHAVTDGVLDRLAQALGVSVTDIPSD